MSRSIIARGALALAAMCLFATSAAATQNIPSNAELYRMLLAQQKEIARQRSEIETLKRRDSANTVALRSTRSALDQARRDASAARRTSEEAVTLAARAVTPAAGGSGSGNGAGVQVASATPFIRLDKAARQKWSAAVGALFLRPGHDFLEFATSTKFPGEEPLKQVGIEPGFNPGVEASLGYAFAGSAFDFKLGYMGLSSRSGGQASVGGDSAPFLSAINVSRDNRAKAQFVVHAESKANFDINVADIEGGANLMLGESFGLRLFTGLRFAHIATRMDSEYTGLNVAPTNELAVYERNTFYGAGPRVGGSWAWNFGWNGFSLIGGTSAGVLVGHRSTIHGEAANFDNGLNDNHEVERTSTAVVPVVDMMMGLRWEHRMSEKSWLEFETGYMVQAWFGGQSILKAATSQESRTDLELGNIYLDGFFLRGKWIW